MLVSYICIFDMTPLEIRPWFERVPMMLIILNEMK